MHRRVRFLVTTKAHPREGETSSTNKMKPRPCRPNHEFFHSSMSTTPWSMSILHRIVSSDVLPKAWRSKIVRHEKGSPPRGKACLDQQNEASFHADPIYEIFYFPCRPSHGFHIRSRFVVPTAVIDQLCKKRPRAFCKQRSNRSPIGKRLQTKLMRYPTTLL
jgi:hypothetical protein